MYSFKPIALLLALAMALQTIPGYAVGKVDSVPFVKIRIGTAMLANLAPAFVPTSMEIERGRLIIFQFVEQDVVNAAKVTSPLGEVMLLTKSLDKVITLSTDNLPPGEYLLEVRSGIQITSTRLQVR